MFSGETFIKIEGLQEDFFFLGQLIFNLNLPFCFKGSLILLMTVSEPFQ